jgi:hypothetical protein
MQRHFSNRGEALAELTAARMMASRRRPRKSAFATQANRRATTMQWFSQPVGIKPQPKKKQPNRTGEVTTSL